MGLSATAQEDDAKIGDALRRWKLVRTLPASVVADRTSISRDTLRSFKRGDGTGARFDAMLAVARVLEIQNGSSRRSSSEANAVDASVQLLSGPEDRAKALRENPSRNLSISGDRRTAQAHATCTEATNFRSALGARRSRRSSSMARRVRVGRLLVS